MFSAWTAASSAVSCIILLTRPTALTDSLRESMAPEAIELPLLISSMEISISSFVVFAALELSRASFPISSATTAKPFPASPARAASIEAFKDKRFVCDAMSSMVWIIPTTCWEVSWILSMASIISFIFSWFCPIITAACAVAFAESSALRRLFSTWSATVFVVSVSCSTEAACCSAASASIWEAVESSEAPLETLSELSLMLVIIWFMEPEILSRAVFIFWNSPA